MSEIIKQAVRKSPLFEHLDERWQKRLIEAATVQSFSAGEVIIREGDTVDALFIVLSGQVQVSSRVGERTLELGSLGAGAYFGEVSLLSGKAATASIEAQDADVGVLEIGRELLRELLDDDPDTRRILEEMTLTRAKDTISKALK